MKCKPAGTGLLRTGLLAAKGLLDGRDGRVAYLWPWTDSDWGWIG